MVIRKLALPRRTFLRGLGAATIALPFLDAMVPALSAAEKPALRLGFFYVPNGMNMANWRHTGSGSALEIPPTLASLAAYREQMTMVGGLANMQALVGIGSGPHTRLGSLWLNGVLPLYSETEIRAGETIDQMAANVMGRDTPLRSLEVTQEPTIATICEAGYSCAYYNTFSWRTPTTPMPMENNPRVVFERLFGEGGSPAERLARTQADRSLLDWLTSDIARLQHRLGQADRATVSEYLEAIRDVERRIQAAEKHSAVVPLSEKPVGLSDSFEARVTVMFDLIALAYQGDVTRVVSFQMGREQSAQTYPEVGALDGHHTYSHHAGDPEKKAILAKINAYHVGLFRGLLEKLHTTRDGAGSLLDHSALLYGAGMSDPNLHDPEDLPLLLVGSGCGRLKGGRYLQAAPGTPMMNLGLSLLDLAGAPVDSVGDSTGRLADLVSQESEA